MKKLTREQLSYLSPSVADDFVKMGIGEPPASDGSARVEVTSVGAFLVCDWGEEESTWFPIHPHANLPPSQWADHPADDAPDHLQQELWDLADKAWRDWKQNAEVSHRDRERQPAADQPSEQP